MPLTNARMILSRIFTDHGLVTSDFDLIRAEDRRQLSKWGCQSHDVFEWLGFTTEELGELSKAISEHIYRNGDPEDIVKEAVQTATLALKIAVMVNAELTRVGYKR